LGPENAIRNKRSISKKKDKEIKRGAGVVFMMVGIN
jgi:hypothetical protein